RAHPDLYSFPTRRSSDLHSPPSGHFQNWKHINCLFPVPAEVDSDIPRSAHRWLSDRCSIPAHWSSSSRSFVVPPVRSIPWNRELDRKSTRLNSSHVKISY